MDRGVLVKDTHGSTIRLAPPLVVTAEELDFAIDQLTPCYKNCAPKTPLTRGTNSVPWSNGHQP